MENLEVNLQSVTVRLVYVDIDMPAYNINIEMMKNDVTEKTHCIFLAHTLDNQFNIAAVGLYENIIKTDEWE